ncbi:lipase 3-like [Bicyclus anynana]|uniref:Lipase n=1 Tax=Bicyclus anynana TaxID=110368 RepID=A0ABM3LPB6_BICAN|nr:lipase 3-like [Bicyclus anynana]
MYAIQLFLKTITYLVLISKICDGFIEVKDIKNSVDSSENNETNLNVTQLAKYHGYNIETHKVITDDGYILSVHRIPSRKPIKNTSVVFLMHGILDCADSWLLQGPNKALAYTLVDKGYDVWMGNARGNKYSSTHAFLDTGATEYWKFSWEEIGFYDLPAMIDYVLAKTEKESLYYVGHSQGTTAFFAMLALKPEYNPKVNMMFALAPITWISNAKSPIFNLFTPAYGIFKYFTSNLNNYSTNVDIFKNIPKLLCKFLPIGCDNVLQWIIGNDYKFINVELLPVIYGHMSSGSSLMQFIHYGQMFQSGRFCRFDYGETDNLAKYGAITPPEYDLNRVTVPVVLFYSTNDWLSDLEDVKQLFAKLPNVYDSYNINRFNHVDYMFADVAKVLIYSVIIKKIEEFEFTIDEL